VSKPVEKAFGIRRTPAGWQVTEFEIVGEKVVKRKTSEPDMRALALETLQREITVFWETSD
jgi:hypothetical protein